MFRFPILLRGLFVAGALAFVSIPAAAQAGGGKGFCGSFGGSFGGYYGGCYPSYCYQPNYCYRPNYCYQPVCYPVVTTSYPVVTVSQPQPWLFNCHQPVYRTQYSGGTIMIKSR
jgi:hypothetical protein